MSVVDGVRQHLECYAIGCKGLQYQSPVCSMCSMLSTAGDVHCQCLLTGSQNCLRHVPEVNLLNSISYGGAFYNQQEGAAMGSPVCASVGNLYMEIFVEELALTSAPAKPQLWKTYMDDTRCIVRKGTKEGLLSHLKSVRPSIKFTVEVEKDGSLPFLNTLHPRGEMTAAWMSPSTGSPHTD